MFMESKTHKYVTNSGMVLEVLRMTVYGNHNTVLLKRITDGQLITARDLEFKDIQECSWYWGHYFSKESEYSAYQNFIQREKEMLSYILE